MWNIFYMKKFLCLRNPTNDLKTQYYYLLNYISTNIFYICPYNFKTIFVRKHNKMGMKINFFLKKN